MVSGEEQRKNPPGAVGKNIRWQERNSKIVGRWKNIMRALHKGDPSPDVSNIELFRPHSTPQDLPMAGAQIPGVSYHGTHPSEAYKEGHERTFGPSPGQEAVTEPAPQPPSGAPDSVFVTVAESPKAEGDESLVQAKCGAMKDRRGIASHERFCADCKAATQPESA
jgi:hypothetical protein